MNPLLMKFFVHSPGSKFIALSYLGRRTVSHYPAHRNLQSLNNLKQHNDASYFSTCSNFLQPNEVRELLIPIEYGNIAAKAWGKEKGYPVLAFHGWLDNCGTFDKLFPLLTDKLHIVGLDAPGHGRSSHRPPGCFYTDISLVIDAKKMADHLGWTKFSIIGHSMGGCLGLMFASLFPNMVEKLVALDIHKPSSRDVKLFPGETIKAIENHMAIERKLSNPPPVYTAEAAAERLQKGMFNEVTLENARILNKRGTAPSECGKGVVFRRDLRCRTIEQFSRRSHEFIFQFMTGVKCELLMFAANNSHPNYTTATPEVRDLIYDVYRKNTKKFILQHVDGNHFVHLNNPERIAPKINEFFSDVVT